MPLDQNNFPENNNVNKLNQPQTNEPLKDTQKEQYSIQTFDTHIFDTPNYSDNKAADVTTPLTSNFASLTPPIISAEPVQAPYQYNNSVVTPAHSEISPSVAQATSTQYATANAAPTGSTQAPQSYYSPQNQPQPVQPPVPQQNFNQQPFQQSYYAQTPQPQQQTQFYQPQTNPYMSGQVAYSPNQQPITEQTVNAQYAPYQAQQNAFYNQGYSNQPPVKAKTGLGIKLFIIFVSLFVAISIIVVGIYISNNKNSTDNSTVTTSSDSSNPYAGGYTTSSSPNDTTGNSALTPPDGTAKAIINLNALPTFAVPDVSSMLQTAANSVVGIDIYSLITSDEAQASGIIVSSDGYILTDDHIYAGIPQAHFVVYTSDGASHVATYVAGDQQDDIAVLKMTSGVYSPATFGDSNSLKVGDKVYAIGCPGGLELMGSKTAGMVSAVNRRVADENGSKEFIQTDAAINPGNSGGALVNVYGQVVGVNAAKLSSSAGFEGIGFAIPSKNAKTAFDSLIKYGYIVNRARLGVTFLLIDTVASLKNNEPTGTMIKSISPTSKLYGKAEPNEIITSINGKPILTDNDLFDVMDGLTPNDSVKLTICGTDGKIRTVTCGLLPNKGVSSYVTGTSVPSFDSSIG